MHFIVGFEPCAGTVRRAITCTVSTLLNNMLCKLCEQAAASKKELLQGAEQCALALMLSACVPVNTLFVALHNCCCCCRLPPASRSCCSCSATCSGASDAVFAIQLQTLPVAPTAQLLLLQAATSKQELLQLLSNIALGLMPETLRAADGPQPEAQDFLIRGMAIDKAGFMVVGDAVRVGQRVRFMVSLIVLYFI
jgi:hypothetical protein